MIIKNFSKMLLAAVVLVSLASCEKDLKDFTPPAVAHFVANAATSSGYVLNAPAPGTMYKIPVGTTTVTTADRKVKLTYEGTAVRGTEYTAPDEITIPAGSAMDTVRIQTLFAGFPQNVTRTIKVKIANADGYITKGNGLLDSFVLSLQRPCDVNTTTLAGAYTKTYENGTYGPYTSTVGPFTMVPGSTTSATATISNIYESGISAVATFDWSNVPNYTVVIAPQGTQLASGGNQLFIRTVTGGGSTFNPCSNTLTLRLNLYTTAGNYDTWTTTMAK